MKREEMELVETAGPSRRSCGPVVTKLLVPISQIRKDVELMNDIAEVGARGFQMVSWMKQIEEPNEDLRNNLSKQLD